jgi:UDP-glucose 4-epimerase
VAKLAAEKYVQLYHALHGLAYTILRYANVYGPRQNPQGEAGVTAILAYQMLRGIQPALFGDGSKTRDYVHVSDIARANVLALERGAGEIFNLGTGRQITDRYVFQVLAEATQYEGEPQYLPRRPGEVLHSALDCTRARESLGWQPQVPFEAGVQSVVEYERRRLAQSS